MGLFANRRVRRIVTVAGQDIRQFVNLAVIENGRTLLLNGEKHRPARKDRFNDTIQEVTLESTPGRRHTFLTFDSAIVAKIQALKHNQLVNATGVPTRNGAFLIETFEVVETPAAPTAGPSAV